ncbi:MAG: hypothetical protein LBF41_04770 [Deltaproteobacteria bacterium]|jgi:hypothetical protein|nr:hypothetical protein [Deltaproteobacteria bacterium]
MRYEPGTAAKVIIFLFGLPGALLGIWLYGLILHYHARHKETGTTPQKIPNAAVWYCVAPVVLIIFGILIVNYPIVWIRR